VLAGALTSWHPGRRCCDLSAGDRQSLRFTVSSGTLTALDHGDRFTRLRGGSAHDSASAADHSRPARHLDRYAQPGADGLVFTRPNGAQLHRSNFRRRVWLPALALAGLPEVHFHDLRHTGNVLTAAAGASLRELMARMGHASTRGRPGLPA
jgi:integrase